ncbi:MAG: efflux RND transporter periplasmic adaptor subunit [Nannocystales bacterium]
MSSRRLLVWGVFSFACGGAPGLEETHDEHRDEARSSRVHIAPHVLERNGVRTERAVRRVLLGSLRVPADVQINSDQVAHVSPLLPGRLRDPRVTLGQRVKRGDVLATVDSADLGRRRGALRAAQARKRAADAGLARAEALVGAGISALKTKTEARSRAEQAGAEVAAIRSALSVYDRSRGSGVALALTSTIDGTIVERHAGLGEYVDETSDPFVVANLESVWVVGRVYEQQIGDVSVGMRGEATFIAHPEKAWSGVVDYIAPTLDPETRTLAVRMVLKNPALELRPGMFGTMALQEDPQGVEAREVLTVPSVAVSTVGDRSVVFVRGEASGEFVARDVVTGSAVDGVVEVRAGLSEEEEVVTSGIFLLKSVLLKRSIGAGHGH